MSDAGRSRSAVVLVSLALVSCLLGVDVWLGYRKMVGGDRHERIENVHQPHPRLGWTLVPGTGLHENPGNFAVRYGIDPDGLRHVENRGSATSQLWLFGDSFTFGHGVRDADTFASVIAREWLAPGRHVRNAGVSAYGIAQQLQRLIELEDRVRPGDVVVFAPVSVDLERSLKHFGHPSKYAFRAEKGKVRAYPDWRDGRLVIAPFDTLTNRVRALLYNARFTGPGLRQLHHLLAPPRVAEEAAEMLEAARAISAKRGARFALLFLPHPRECATDGYRVDLSRFAFPDLKPFFPSRPDELSRIQFPSDPHWNARGHALAARAVVETLLREGVLAPEEVVRK